MQGKGSHITGWAAENSMRWVGQVRVLLIHWHMRQNLDTWIRSPGPWV